MGKEVWAEFWIRGRGEGRANGSGAGPDLLAGGATLRYARSDGDDRPHRRRTQRHLVRAAGREPLATVNSAMQSRLAISSAAPW
jgi:hypothetical protein